MVVEVKSFKDIKKAKKAISNNQSVKIFEAYKFCGALKVGEDPGNIQQRFGDEWE